MRPGEHDHAGDRGGQDAEAVDEVVHDIQNVDPLVVLKKIKLIPAAGTPTISVADRRVSSNLSRTADMTTSITLTSDVRPAKTNDPKNRTPISAPAGASLMIVGKATKASPRPSDATSSTASPEAWAMKPSAANTPDAGKQFETRVRQADDQAGAGHVRALGDVGTRR